jgi:hypothetical protein
MQKARQLGVEKRFASRNTDHSITQGSGVIDCSGKQQHVLLLPLVGGGA